MIRKKSIQSKPPGLGVWGLENFTNGSKLLYGDFSLSKAKAEFGFKIVEKRGIFDGFLELPASPLLADLLDYQLPIALASNS